MTEEPMAVAREMTRLEYLWSRLGIWFFRFRRRLPYLVWYGDELDVGVILSRYKLNPDGDPTKQLFTGTAADVEIALRDMGISFDTGIGNHGRDWEWDWSLRGPISVRFKSRATAPQLRMERPRPRLIAS